MKRLLVLSVVALSFVATTFASEPTSVIDKLNDQKTFDRVANYLGADYDQREGLQYVFNESSRRLNKATEKGATVGEATEKALYFNLANARVILSSEQYKKFLSLINLTINNEEKTDLLAEK